MVYNGAIVVGAEGFRIRGPYLRHRTFFGQQVSDSTIQLEAFESLPLRMNTPKPLTENVLPNGYLEKYGEVSTLFIGFCPLRQTIACIHTYILSTFIHSFILCMDTICIHTYIHMYINIYRSQPLSISPVQDRQWIRAVLKLFRICRRLDYATELAANKARPADNCTLLSKTW